MGGATWPRRAIPKHTHEMKTSGQVCVMGVESEQEEEEEGIAKVLPIIDVLGYDGQNSSFSSSSSSSSSCSDSTPITQKGSHIST